MVLNGEVIEALSNVLCIEIILRTNEGDEMVLEVWTVRVAPGGDTSQGSVSTIYYRMSIMLKSTLSISRITPAYKLSRLQNKDSYIIFHKIYGGKPNLDLLGVYCLNENQNVLIPVEESDICVSLGWVGTQILLCLYFRVGWLETLIR